MKLSLIATVAAVVVSCTGCPKPQPPLDPSDPDASCLTACVNVREMSCEGWATPKGGACEDVCELAAKNAIAWPVGCLSSAKSCNAADRCR